jgi:predicted branched-subunit amino acid permease
MLRLLPMLLLAALLGLAAIAAGFAIDAPTIALFVFAGCLSLFVVALTAGAFNLYEH